jgi:hypothetical protein
VLGQNGCLTAAITGLVFGRNEARLCHTFNLKFTHL